MKATTGQILGKAHKLCEWLREEDTPIYPGRVSTVPLSWGVERATKWYVGDVDDLPSGLDRSVIDSIPVRLPCKQMLIEAECFMRMADDREEPMTAFALCYDREGGEIDVFLFGHGVGRFWFSGGGRICIEPNGTRGWRHYGQNGKPAQGWRDVGNGMAMIERTLVALTCTNVRSVDNAPPSALNKKRQKAGKPPLFTYKTLHILSGERGASHDQKDDDAEAKRSPRLHFRRGHVRRIGDGRITWVQQCMVGNRRLGVVEKAYALEAR